MANITETTLVKGESTTVGVTTLDGGDTFTFTINGQRLTFENTTGGLITANLLGTGVTGTKKCQGGGEVDLSLGFDMAVAAGATVAVNLIDVKDYLGASGNVVNISNGSGLNATLVVD